MAFKKAVDAVVDIQPARIIRSTVRIIGTAPLVQHAFSAKAREQIMLSQSTPKVEKPTRAQKEARNFDEEFKAAQHISTEGWNGIPCGAFRSAMIDACRTVGLVMTKAKMSVWVIADGFDRENGTPLVRIIAKPPERHEDYVRLESGVCSVAVRPMWREWACDVTVEFDEDMITSSSVINLLDRAGRQVGVGEGRMFSRNSVGQGWGSFMVAQGKPKPTASTKRK